MHNLILVSHGNFAQEILRSAEMIMGEINAHTLCLQPHEGAEDFQRKLDSILATLSGDTVIFADLLGGTPCNVSFRLASQRGNIQIITGLNLSMILSFVGNDYELDTQALLDDAKSAIVDVLAFAAQSSDDDDE